MVVVEEHIRLCLCLVLVYTLTSLMLFLFIDGISADSDLMFLLGGSFGVKAEGTVSLISLRQDRLNSIVCNNDPRI